MGLQGAGALEQGGDVRGRGLGLCDGWKHELALGHIGDVTDREHVAPSVDPQEVVHVHQARSRQLLGMVLRQPGIVGAIADGPENQLFVVAVGRRCIRR